MSKIDIYLGRVNDASTAAAAANNILVMSILSHHNMILTNGGQIKMNLTAYGRNGKKSKKMTM